MTALNKKIKTVVADVRTEVSYIAEAKCPYCKAHNSDEVEEDNITIKHNCWDCERLFKVKIPKDSI